MENQKNLTIGILLSMLSAFLMSTLFLFYKVILTESMNNSLEQENGMLLRDIRKLEGKLCGKEQKEKKEA
ncbi:MAG: hypothetical protein ACLSX5_14820 [Lachnospiraceae bacterium]